ncbi:MAG: LicD family protein [Erysipelotrichaceae bacterium]|nr:LicD family protein [Erysipelotrichaceae bacterium]
MKKNVELDLPEIHSATLQNLATIIDICVQLNINYYLAFGSLIGAIRNNGFIPWDDDCDIIMLRTDYEKFKQYCIQNESKIAPYKLLCRENTHNYPYNIARFNDMRYKAVYENTQQYDSGLFVDIYPFDQIGELSVGQLRKLDNERSYLQQMILLSTDDHYEKSKHNKWYRSIIKYVMHSYAKLRGQNYFMDKMEGLKDKYYDEKGNNIAELVWDFKTVICKKEWFEKALSHQFENLTVKIPSGYDAFLRTYYGDYMKLPPMEDRHPTHEYKLYKR